MPKLITIILLLLTGTQLFGQDSSRLMNYHLGINLNYAGERSPDFTLPLGVGIGVTATLNKFSKLKPAIELSGAGFSEYVIHLTNNNNNDSKYSYGIYNLLAGTKYELNRLAKVSLTAGFSLNSIEETLQSAVKTSLEINTKSNKLTGQLYYLKIVGSQIINGYTGIAILFKIR